MNWMSHSRQLEKVLRTCRTIAVVGLSATVTRPSYLTAIYMQDHGYRIIPVNPNYTEILGEQCFPDLRSVPARIDMVNIFQRPERIVPIVQQAINIQAKVVWMQLGIINQDAAQLAKEAGLEVIMNHCVKIEHAHLLGNNTT